MLTASVTKHQAYICEMKRTFFGGQEDRGQITYVHICRLYSSCKVRRPVGAFDFTLHVLHSLKSCSWWSDGAAGDALQLL